MIHMVFIKDKTTKLVKSVTYDLLKDELKAQPEGLVGVEMPSGGLFQHYFYQLMVDDIQRFVLRQLNQTYSCMSGYSSLVYTEDKNQAFFGTPKSASLIPKLPARSLFFIEDDINAIHDVIQLERAEKLKPRQEFRYFPDLPLTQGQQDYLFNGPVLTGNIIFKEELRDILAHLELTLDEKEAILKTCISKERIKLREEAEVLAQAMKACFFSIGKLITYPVDILSSAALTNGSKTIPTLGAIQHYYVQCIQSHLQQPVEKELLTLFPPLIGILSLGTIPPNEAIESYKGLTEREELCFNALNVLLLSGPNSKTHIKAVIENNLKFQEVLSDLVDMLNDLKDAVDNCRPTTSKPKYEMIYREFFIAHEIDLASLHQLKTLDTAYSALLDLRPLILSLKTEKLLNEDLSAAEILTLFLESVVKCDMDTVDLLLQRNSSLLVHKGDVIDYSGREWKNISAVQYASWALDTELFEKMMGYISDDEDGDFLREQIRTQVKEADSNGLCFLKQGQKFVESQYNFTKLTDLYRKYLKQFERKFFHLQMVSELQLLLGQEQRNVPVHVAHRFCNPDEPFKPTPQFDTPLRVRSLAIHDVHHGKIDHWWSPPYTYSGWGSKVPTFWSRGSADVRRGGPTLKLRNNEDKAAKIDLEALEALFKKKVKSLALLKKEHLPPRQRKEFTMKI